MPVPALATMPVHAFCHKFSGVKQPLMIGAGFKGTSLVAPGRCDPLECNFQALTVPVHALATTPVHASSRPSLKPQTSNLMPKASDGACLCFEKSNNTNDRTFPIKKDLGKIPRSLGDLLGYPKIKKSISSCPSLDLLLPS